RGGRRRPPPATPLPALGPIPLLPAARAALCRRPPARLAPPLPASARARNAALLLLQTRGRADGAAVPAASAGATRLVDTHRSRRSRRSAPPRNEPPRLC